MTKRKSQPDFIAFKKQFNGELAKATNENWASESLVKQARFFWKEFSLSESDYSISLTDEGVEQAKKIGENLLDLVDTPDVIYVSPYKRTKHTLEAIQSTAPGMKDVKVISEERIREQEHGLATVYNDNRIYLTLNPTQALLWKLEHGYEYR